MSEVTKQAKKSLKSLIANAIQVALSKNKHLKDKKVQKEIDKSASDIAKKLLKADKVKIVKASTPVAKKAISKTTKKPVKTATAKKIVKKPVKA